MKEGRKQKKQKKTKSLKWLEFLGVSFHSNNSGTLIKVRRAAAAPALRRRVTDKLKARCARCDGNHFAVTAARVVFPSPLPSAADFICKTS